MTGLLDTDVSVWSRQLDLVGWHPPTFQLAELWQRDSNFCLAGRHIPMGLFNVLGSLRTLTVPKRQAIATRAELFAVQWVGTVVAAVFGSCFPTTIISAIAWKAMGARIGYSWLDGIVVAVCCFLGLFGLIGQLIPIEAGMAIVLHITQDGSSVLPGHTRSMLLRLLSG